MAEASASIEEANPQACTGALMDADERAKRLEVAHRCFKEARRWKAWGNAILEPVRERLFEPVKGPEKEVLRGATRDKNVID